MRTAITTKALIEAMAERSGRSIEIHNDVAYLVTPGVIWTAKLSPAGGAA